MPRLISWTDRCYFDINYDAEICKISGFDENHQEYWCIIETGKGFRDRRIEALERMMDWIEAGKPTGEVNNDN